MSIPRQLLTRYRIALLAIAVSAVIHAAVILGLPGQMTRGDVHFIRESTRVYLRDVLDHLIRLYENVELYRDIAMSARDVYLSNISNHLNQIMKVLTIITVIALPMTIVTSFFGMNFQDVSWWDRTLHSPTGFVVGMGMVLVLDLALLALLR